jgi:CheY-like chemotaxis protein
MASAQQPTRSVLIVEDDLDIRETLAEILQDEGYPVATAANGREAMAHLRSRAPTCVILLDLMMPIMNGWEFRAEQQQDPALAQIPVVVVSGDGNVAQKAASLSVDGYLAKPIDLDRLLDTVAAYCR